MSEPKKYRPVQVEARKWIQPPEGNGKWQDFKFEGRFHQWGEETSVMYRDNEPQDMGTHTVAIVEDEMGGVWTVNPNDIKFLDRIQKTNSNITKQK